MGSNAHPYHRIAIMARKKDSKRKLKRTLRQRLAKRFKGRLESLESRELLASDLLESLARNDGTVLSPQGAPHLDLVGPTRGGEVSAAPPDIITASLVASNQTLENVVNLKAGDRSLETSHIVINERTWIKYPILGIAIVLDYMAGWIKQIGLPYAYGFAIIFFTVAVRAATFPLNKKQIESTKATQEIQPILKELQKKHGDDREKLAQEQMRLYKEYGVNPLGGCLPLIVQMPIWLSLKMPRGVFANIKLKNWG